MADIGIPDVGIADIGIAATMGGRWMPGMATGAMGSIGPPALMGIAGVAAAYGCCSTPWLAVGTDVPAGTLATMALPDEAAG